MYVRLCVETVCSRHWLIQCIGKEAEQCGRIVSSVHLLVSAQLVGDDGKKWQVLSCISEGRIKSIGTHILGSELGSSRKP